MKRDDNIAKVSRTPIGMDEEHREHDFVLNPKTNYKPEKTGLGRYNMVMSTQTHD